MWGYGPGMMGYGGYGIGGGMFFGGILWIVFLAAIAYFLIKLLRGDVHEGFRSNRRPAALDVLEERYARGEIGRDEFLEKKADISTGERGRKR
jgi:putative membrane protein